jgi:prepilin-type processing-associated H-X9-DG protein
MGQWTSLRRGRRSTKASADEWVAWDDFNFLPYTPGAMAPLSPGAAYTLSPSDKWIIPHRGVEGPRRAMNMLYMDGHVGLLTYKVATGGWVE